MLTKLMLIRHQTLTISHPKFPKFLTSLATVTATATTNSIAVIGPVTVAAAYGPSLQKGISPLPASQNPFPRFGPKPSQNPQLADNVLDELEELPPFDEGQFTRLYEVTAIRVPAEKCFEIEGRIRGHLLNWPRVSNIARVCGDDFDHNSGFVGLGSVGEEGEGEGEGGTELSEVLYRDKLAKEFNANGFVKFRNLARISRPCRRRRGKKETGKGRGGGMRTRTRRRSVVVEVVEEDGNVGGGDDLRVLLGESFGGRKWNGPTRLLLLDEKYAGRKVDELPEAVKAVLNNGSIEDSFELVKCKLTLFYEYWPSDEILSALLPKNMIILSAFETVGHVAHLNLKDEHLPYKQAIAKVILDKNKPKIQTVVNKIEAISNHYRTMQLEVLAGNRSLVTTVIENGLRFHLDLSTVYWNSRLATERQRLVNSFARDDVLCDVFSGVGPIAISAAKKVKRVYANDLNPSAVDYLERNCVLNKLERKIKVFNMDGRRFIETVFSDSNAHSITQVVMNLPNDAVEFLDAFRGIFSNRDMDRKLTFPTIHVYGFSKAEDPEFDFHERIRVALGDAAFAVEMRRVRQVAPGKWMLCATFVLPERVALTPKQ